MSYSTQIKYSIFRYKKNNCCKKSELFGFLIACGALGSSSLFRFALKNYDFFEYYVNLLKNICQIKIDENEIICRGNKEITYIVEIKDVNKINIIYSVFFYPQSMKNIECFFSDEKTCCYQSFLRGAFISTGFISDPKKTYALEIVLKNSDSVNMLNNIFIQLGLEPKLGTRNNNSIVYFKNSSDIGDFLAMIGAKKSSFEYVNTEIEKTILNSVNRVMNCENANIDKLVTTAEKQKNAILLLKENNYKSVEPSLIELSELRLENMEASYDQLGSMLSPPLSKSGVAHRMKKILQLSKNLYGGI